MKKYQGIMVCCALGVMLLSMVFEGYAQESCENVIYTPISISPPYSGDILSVAKIDDNNFYVLLSGTLPTSSSNKTALPVQVLRYLNGSWASVGFAPTPSSLNRIFGGGGSTVFAVGNWGQIYNIQGTNATYWNDPMGPVNSGVDLKDACSVDSTIVAVGLEHPSMNPTVPVIFTGSPSQPNQWLNVFTGEQGSSDKSFNAVACNQAGQCLAVGNDGSSPLAAYSDHNGQNWTPVDFFSVGNSVPPLLAVSYDEASASFLMAGNSTIVHYRFGMPVVPCDVRNLPVPGQINGLFRNIAVGHDGNMTAAGAVFCYNGDQWTNDPSVPSGSSVLNALDGGSDIFVVGDAGTILRRESGTGPVAATPVPALSHWGTILLLLAMVTFGALALKRRRENSPSKAN